MQNALVKEAQVPQRTNGKLIFPLKNKVQHRYCLNKLSAAGGLRLALLQVQQLSEMITLIPLSNCTATILNHEETHVLKLIDAHRRERTRTLRTAVNETPNR